MKIISQDRVLKLSNTDITKREYEGDVNCINPRTDNEKLWFEGEYSSSVIDGDFQSGFPTRFIWTKDEVWQKEVLNHIAQNR